MQLQFVRRTCITLALLAQVGGAQIPYLLTDLAPENSPDANRHPKLLATLGTTLFFSVEEPSLGVELWISQGSAESTAPVADLCPGPCWGAPTALGVAGGRFYFVAHFSDLWSDLAVYSVLPSGLDLQRVLVQSDDVRLAFLESPYPQGYFAEAGGRGVFVAMLADGRKSLWSSSGSASDTAQFFEFADPLDDRFPHGLTQLDGSRVTFFVTGSSTGAPDELWVTDGLTAGTRSIQALGSYSLPGGQEVVGSNLLFIARSPTGSDLWRSDGTEAGTVRLTDFEDPTSRVFGFEAGESRIYFVVVSATAGQELWSTDGSPASTHAATSIGYHEPFGSIYTESELHAFMAVSGTRAYFIASDGIHSPQLLRTDGDPSSVRVVGEICNQSECGGAWVEAVGGRALFSGASSLGVEPMITDAAGTTATVLLDICPGSCSSRPQSQKVLSTGRMTFSTYPNPFDSLIQLWSTDGTAART